MPSTSLPLRYLLDNGFMFALAALALFVGFLGAWLGFKWVLSLLGKCGESDGVRPVERRAQCNDCVFAEGVRDPRDLIAHRVFGSIRLARATIIPHLPVAERGRKAVFGDLLDINFRICSEVFLSWLKDNIADMDTWRSDTLASELLELIGNLVETYESEAMRHGIPAVVVEAFGKWNQVRMTQLRSEIILVCESEWIGSSAQRFGYLLSVVESTWKLLLLDAEKTLEGLNGQLTGIIYKGVLIGPCPPRHGEAAARPPSQK